MTTRRLSRGLLAALVVAGAAASCNEPSSRVPTRPTAPSGIFVTILGPTSIAPGQSARFTVTVRLGDGTVKSVDQPADVRWFSNASVLQITNTGVATAKQTMTETTVSVEVRLPGTAAVLRGTKSVLILPDGTFRVAGRVFDQEFPVLSIGGALVELTSGSASTTTAADGSYQLFGVPATATIRVTKSGYVTATQDVQLTDSVTRDFALALSGPRPTLSGNYTLAIDQGNFCSGNFAISTDLQHRRYEAVLTQTGPFLTVTLTEPRFLVNSAGKGNKFSGAITPTGATFTLNDYIANYYYYYVAGAYPSVVEKLPDGSVLAIEGPVTTTLSGTVLTGTLNGWMSQWAAGFPGTLRFLKGCFSATSQFSLTPR